MESKTRCFKIILSYTIIGIIHNFAEGSFATKKLGIAQCEKVRIFFFRSDFT